jgi:hypothetical protein
MTDIHTTSGPIELRCIRQPLDYSTSRCLFDGLDEEYSPLPGLAIVIGIAASLIGLGALIGCLIWSA